MKHCPRDVSLSDNLKAKLPDGSAGDIQPESYRPTVVSYPVVADQAEWSEVITLYDRQHFLTYARLLDAERDNIDWRKGVRDILLQDPDKDADQARICWNSHLERARWIATVGFQQAIAHVSGR